MFACVMAREQLEGGKATVSPPPPHTHTHGEGGRERERERERERTIEVHSTHRTYTCILYLIKVKTNWHTLYGVS